MLEKTSTEIPIEIKHEDLSPDALHGVIENFILREGTDYGAREVSFHKKAEQLLKQIKNGRLKIYFDQGTETVSLVPANAPR